MSTQSDKAKTGIKMARTENRRHIVPNLRSALYYWLKYMSRKKFFQNYAAFLITLKTVSLNMYLKDNSILMSILFT